MVWHGILKTKTWYLFSVHPYFHFGGASTSGEGDLSRQTRQTCGGGGNFTLFTTTCTFPVGREGGEKALLPALPLTGTY